MTNRTCVVGGHGFLGSHIVDALHATGTHVVVYARSPERFRAPNPAITVVTGDFMMAENLDVALSGVDTVIHTLTSVTIQASNADMVYDVQSNLIATIRLLEKCVEHGVKRVVFLSSGGAVYGATQVHPTPVTTPPSPMSSYGATKLAIEHYLSVFQALHGLEYCTLRIANPYGPRQDPNGNQGVVAIFASKVLTGDEISLFGDGSAQRDYIHAADCASAVVAAATSSAANYIANVGSGRGASLRDVITALEAASGKTANVIHLPARSGEVAKSVLDISRFQTLTGWSPRIDLDDGIADVIAWMQRDPD